MYLHVLLILFQDDKAPQKSKEELEKEKQATLAQRIQPLTIDGLDVAKLKEAAQNLHDKIKQLVSNKYDLEERFKRQQYDVSIVVSKMHNNNTIRFLHIKDA